MNTPRFMVSLLYRHLPTFIKRMDMACHVLRQWNQAQKQFPVGTVPFTQGHMSRYDPDLHQYRYCAMDYLAPHLATSGLSVSLNPDGTKSVYYRPLFDKDPVEGSEEGDLIRLMYYNPGISTHLNNQIDDEQIEEPHLYTFFGLTEIEYRVAFERPDIDGIILALEVSMNDARVALNFLGNYPVLKKWS